MTSLIDALAEPDQPRSFFTALERLVDQTIGIKLFTLMQVDLHRAVAWRNYSNRPDAYPALGEKPIQNNAWTEIVQDRQETFVANSIDEMAAVFPDYELIQSLGCESCLNLPIVVGGKVIGTLNCLHEAGHYTPERVLAADSLKQAGALAFLLNAYTDKGAGK